MNVLSKLLNYGAERGNFTFHPRCKKIKLTHLCFADDLLVFCKGDNHSVNAVYSIMDFFHQISGLEMNCSKTEAFCADIDNGVISAIQSCTGFSIGSLPVRYLGIPLTAKALSSGDCQTLIMKITDKIQSWTSKYLSYAGRLQLLHSVIFSIYNYWCRMVIFPSKVIKSIISICSAYLWKGQVGNARGAAVSWDSICLPKKEGGLGFKNIALWNKVCIMRNLWLIWSGDNCLWARWIRCYVLHSDGDDLLTSVVKQSSSWAWKKMARLRPLISQLGGLHHYSPRDAWDTLRFRNDIVPWHKLIWGKFSVPRYSFIAWLAILDRLATRDRLLSWGSSTASICILCNQDDESRDHLFAKCSYSVLILNAVLQDLGYYANFTDWDSLLSWVILNAKGNSNIAGRLKIGWCSYIYFIWKERNSRGHGGINQVENRIVASIKTTIRDKISVCIRSAIP